MYRHKGWIFDLFQSISYRTGPGSPSCHQYMRNMKTSCKALLFPISVILGMQCQDDFKPGSVKICKGMHQYRFPCQFQELFGENSLHPGTGTPGYNNGITFHQSRISIASP